MCPWALETGARPLLSSTVRRVDSSGAGFLYGETQGWHMHVGALILLDPTHAPDLNLEALQRLYAERLAQGAEPPGPARAGAAGPRSPGAGRRRRLRRRRPVPPGGAARAGDEATAHRPARRADVPEARPEPAAVGGVVDRRARGRADRDVRQAPPRPRRRGLGDGARRVGDGHRTRTGTRARRAHVEPPAGPVAPAAGAGSHLLARRAALARHSLREPGGASDGHARALRPRGRPAAARVLRAEERC